MHIAFLTPEYPHPKVIHAAGIGTSIKNLADALTRKGEKVTMFVYGQKNDEIIVEAGLEIHLIKQKNYKFGTWYFYNKHIQNYINKVIISKKIDIIEAPDWTGFSAIMNFRIPLVIRFHGSDAYFCHLENRKQKFKNKFFEKLAISKANAFIAPTKFAGDLSKKLFHIKNKPIKTINYGLELSKFHNLNPEKYEKETILYLGSIIRKKGIFEIPKIFSIISKQFPNAKLILIGSDTFDLQTKSKSTWKLLETFFDNKNVNYLGKIPYIEVQQYIKNAHVCIFPTFAETFGMVTIESMALSKPVVNSNFGWSNELIIDGESGYLVHPKDHQKFADRILDIFSNNDLCSQIGEKARKRVEEVFDIDKIVNQNIDFYKSIIEKK
ncbi:glycosyltransferase family 4 protein [Flavobacterium sp.]|uniref:glycosyltransferase family 4 protein n=1 Tax=Flavobacterium sp. TaxID=239 RepID=UPI0037526E3F